jgi:hypothetical protein
MKGRVVCRVVERELENLAEYGVGGLVWRYIKDRGCGSSLPSLFPSQLSQKGGVQGGNRVNEEPPEVKSDFFVSGKTIQTTETGL